MKKKQVSATKSQRFFGGKGFYIALAICIVAIGAAAWLGVSLANKKLEEAIPPTPPIVKGNEVTDDWAVPEKTIGAEVKKDNVPAEVKPDEIEAPQNTVVSFILPIKGEIQSAYSGDKVVKSKTLDDWIMHTGIDISADISTPVKAMSDGVVVSAGSKDMWGMTVEIDHGNGVVSCYSNLKSALNIKKGQAVKTGDIIGAVGETCDIERAETSHLHWGVKRDGEWIDPMELIG